MDTVGVAILVNHAIVAWFPEWTEEVEQWCRENHFGAWLAYPAHAPVLRTLTDEESLRITDLADELLAKIRPASELGS